MARNKTAVKKFIVTLSDEERGALTALIHTGKHPAQKLLKARILLKADASDAGEGWSDSQIAAALESSVDTVARTRQRPGACRMGHRGGAELVSFGQLYRDRGDSENIFDEMKNQWGWGGFVTQDLARCPAQHGALPSSSSQILPAT